MGVKFPNDGFNNSRPGCHVTSSNRHLRISGPGTWALFHSLSLSLSLSLSFFSLFFILFFLLFLPLFLNNYDFFLFKSLSTKHTRNESRGHGIKSTARVEHSNYIIIYLFNKYFVSNTRLINLAVLTIL